MNKYYSVEQIAEMLGVHQKTIQRYIREGKIRASKIGKSWRVAGDDLSRFTEQASNIPSEDRAESQVTNGTSISSVVDIEVNRDEDAQRIIRSLNAAMNVKPAEFGKASMHTQFLESEGKVRITLWGNIQFVTAILSIIEGYLDQSKEDSTL